MKLTQKMKRNLVIAASTLIALALIYFFKPQWIFGKPILTIGVSGGGSGRYFLVCNNGTIFETNTLDTTYPLEKKTTYVGRIAETDMVALKKELNRSFIYSMANEADPTISDSDESRYAEYRSGDHRFATTTESDFSEYLKDVADLADKSIPPKTGVKYQGYPFLDGIQVRSVDCRAR